MRSYENMKTYEMPSQAWSQGLIAPQPSAAERWQTALSALLKTAVTILLDDGTLVLHAGGLVSAIAAAASFSEPRSAFQVLSSTPSWVMKSNTLCVGFEFDFIASGRGDNVVPHTPSLDPLRPPCWAPLTSCCSTAPTNFPQLSQYSSRSCCRCPTRAAVRS